MAKSTRTTKKAVKPAAEKTASDLEPVAGYETESGAEPIEGTPAGYSDEGTTADEGEE